MYEHKGPELVVMSDHWRPYKFFFLAFCKRIITARHVLNSYQTNGITHDDEAILYGETGFRYKSVFFFFPDDYFRTGVEDGEKAEKDAEGAEETAQN